MLTAIIICFVYVVFLLGVSKAFKVNYTEIIKTTDNIKRGLIYTVGICTVLLTAFAYAFDWLPGVLTYSPRLDKPILWVIPALILAGAIWRFTHAKWKSFTPEGVFYLVVGTFLVGFSEELLVRGIVAGSLFDHGFSLFWVAVLSSVIFGAAHSVNYFNGQDAKTTASQVLMTSFFGLNFFIAYVLSGTLWVPILLHFIHDLSLFSQGGEINSEKEDTQKGEMYIVLALVILPLLALFFLK